MGEGVGQPLSCRYRYRAEGAHLVVVHPERFQIVGLCARNHFNVVDLLHSLSGSVAQRRFVCHRSLTDSEGMSTEAGRGHESRTVRMARVEMSRKKDDSLLFA